MRIESTNTGGGDVVPPMIASLIERIKNAPNTLHFVEELNKARTLQTILAKTELYRWTPVLNRCDDILEEATSVKDNVMQIDACHATKNTTISVLRFTALLFECSSTRRIYASTDRLLALLESSDLDIIAEVLRLLQTISKRSKFLTQRLGPQEQTSLVHNLTSIAQCWGGKLRNVKMTDCVSDDVKLPSLFPFVYSDGTGELITIDQLPAADVPLLSIVSEKCANMDAEHRYCVLARLRMLRNFHLAEHRMQCLIVRLLSISTLIHCRCQTDESQISALLYPGFIEETVALLRTDRAYHNLVDPIQTEALRTLTSIVSLEKTMMVNDILLSLGASSYHGFLAAFTRLIVDDLKRNELGTRGKPTVALGTALFSFIYHLSSVDPGGESLVSSGLTQTLLSVLEYKELAIEQISFATRCSRIIDIFTSIDVTVFNNCRGMAVFIERLVHEVDECRKEQPFVIDTSGDVDDDSFKNTPVKTPLLDRRCNQQRSGLIKGLLTFIKRAIQENHLQDSTRHIMEGGLPEALIHIISNAEFYSDSIYHHALQLVTNFIYQEPTQLTHLQTKHVPYVMLQSMLRKELPNSRDVISHLGNVFTALCLNEQGLRQFKSYRPFDHVFKVVLSLKFIATMKKKRSEMSDAAAGVGSAMDDLLRHQPTLKPLMLDSIITALDMLLQLGQNPPANTKIVMALSRSASKAACQNICSGSGGNTPEADRPPEEELGLFSAGEDDRSDDDEEEAELSMDEMSTIRPPTVDKMGLEMDCASEANDGSRVLPLGDYLLIFAKIFETVLTQANATDMVDGFVEKNGVEKLLALSQLPSLSAELATSHFGQSVAAIMQCILQNGGAGNRLMKSFLEMFGERAGMLLESVPEEGGSYMAHLGRKPISDAIAFINGAIPIISHLSKSSFGGGQYSTDRRSRVHEAWLTDSGKQLHIKLRRVSRYLAWESTLIKMIEPTKVVASTQTDSITDFVPMVEEHTERITPDNVTSEAVDVQLSGTKPAWESASISKAEVDFWRENKPLADMVIKANKSTSDFLSLLSRSCYVPARRNRRYEATGSPMGKAASKMADQVFAAIYRDLKWTSSKAADSSMEFGRLNEVLTQLVVVLFDERSYPFHGMLQRFYTSGCHQVFCDILNDKLSIALDKPPTQPLEMVFTTWFRLAEKLAVKQKMVKSMYRQSVILSRHFNPETYSKLVHSDFFRCLSVLFSRLSAEGVDLRNYQSLCESAISVYKEVAQTLVPSDGESTPRDGGARVEAGQAAQIGEAQIRQMLDLNLGFNRDDVTQALIMFPTANEATEWLINRPAQQDMNQQNITVDVGAVNPGEEGDAGGVSSGGSSARASVGLEEQAAQDDQIDTPIIKPLSELAIDKDVSVSQACIELMPLCKRLMEVGSDLVFSCADMVIGVVDSLDENWKKNQLISKIMIQEILEMARTVIDDPQENLATVLATRIHFVCLLFEHISEDYLEILESYPMVTVLQNLLRTIHEKFELAHMHNALLPPVVLWFDLYDKCHRTQKRRQLLEKLAADKQLRWTYLGDDNEGRYPASRSGKKWIPYAPSAQTQLNAAFFSGKSSVTVKSARDREFTVEFASLKQKENDAHKCPVNLEIPDGVDISLADIVKMESENVWSADESKELLISVVRLLHKGVVHHTAAHSLLSFTARLTRDHTCAKNFLQQGGVVAMLQLRSSHSPCTSALVSLILRQCIDTDDLLRAVYEKTIRQMTSVNSTPLSEYLGIQDNKPKEWYETLKKLAPLAVKNPDVYVTTMEKCTKMASNGSTIQFTGKNLRSGTETSVDMDQIVSLVLREVLSGEWPSENEVPLGHGRMLSRGTLLTLLAELVKTYGGAAGLICGAKEAEQSIIHLLLEKYIDGKDKETMKALKVLIAVLAGCNHSPKAQESLVADVKSSLALIGSSSPAVICTKVDEMCSLMVMMVDSCPSPVVPSGSAHRTPSQTPPNPVMRLFHKKKICNDLVRTITYLQLSHKDSIDTVNQVLKTLETMLRNMNSPAASTQSNHDNVLPSGVARGLLRGLLNEADEGGEDEDPMDDHHHFLEGAERMFREHMDMERAPRNMERELEDLRAQVRALEQAPALANHEHDQDLDDEDREGDDEDDDLLGADEDMLGEEEEEGADDAGEDSAESVSTMEDGGDAEALNEAEEIAEAAMRDEMEQEDAQQGGSVGEGGDETMDVGGDGGPGGEPNEEDTEEEEEDDNDDDDEDDEDDYENDDYHYEDDQPEIFDGMYDDIERPGIVMNGVDDWDIFPTPFGHLGQGAREARQRPAAAEAQHPLLVRPLHIADTAPHVLAHGNSSLIPDYRVVLNRGDALTLTRQNAIRRMGAASRVRAIAQGGAQIFDRLFDMQVRDRHGTVINLMDPSFEREERHLRTPASVPSALDRLTGGIDLLEPLSSLFVSVLCNSLVTRQAKEKVDKEAAAAAAEKEKEKAAAATTSSADSAATTTAEETVSVVVPPLPEVALPAWDLGQRVDLNRRTQDEEAMDVTEPDAPQQQEDVSMDEAPPNSSAATVASSVDGEAEEVMEQHDVAVDTTDSVAAATVSVANTTDSAAPAAEEEAMQATVAVAEPAVDQPSSSTETAAVAENRVPEEFRAVLGDIVLPNGVDPAFLAALPEEMRGEVIRDHERQQRAQRVTAAVPAAAPEVAGTVADGGEAAAANTAEAATPVVAAAVVEPIDQDFLAALPPELQEEILQQHERAVREAEEAARRANAPTVPPPVAPELDGAAVIASLPPGERAQVLAEMDDAELQRLPEAMQAEARRARTHMQNLFEPIHRNVMRIHNLYVRGGAGVPGRLAMRAGGGPGSGRGSASTSTVGNLAGKTSTASAQAVQLLDRESILTLCGLFLVDNRLSISRLQKVIKTVCSHAGSCDFVVWCLQALFEKASESGPDEDEIVSICPSWLESITVAGVGHNERTLRIAKNASKVSVHPLVADTVCRNVLDALITLAKSYPGHFVPAALRSTETTDCRELPPLEQFWQLLQSPSGKALFGKESSLDTRPASEQLKTSALARLIHFFDNAAVQRISLLQDKLLKLLSTVVQTLPNDSTQKLGMSEDSPPLKDEMRTVVNVLTKGTLTAEGFADGRTLLVEAMRALPPSTSEFVYDQLCVAIQEIGLELQPQIETLLTELGDIPDGDMSSPSSSSNLPSTSGRVQSMRLAGDGVVVDGDAIGKLKMNASSCRELRLPSVTALTDVNGAQSSLLSSLQTLTKVRDTMRQMKEDKRKVLEDERKKAAENQKKLEEERKKRDEEAKAKTSVTAESSSSIDVTTTESTAADTSVAAGSSGTGDAETTQEAAKTDKATPVSSSATEEPEVAPIDDPSIVLRSLEQSDSRLSQRLDGLADLWNVVSTCLLRLGKSSDPHAVLALQPAAEAFFLVHAVAKSADHEHPDTVRMIEFAEKHREVLNQVLRQNSQALSPGGPFAILTQFPKLLDFDVKRKYFRKELTKMDGEREYRRADVNVQVRRSQLFSDSFRELFRLRPSDWKKRFYIVFQGEEGQDAGGLLREWFSVITREIFNPNYALFITAPGDMVTYMINKASHINPEHLDYFKFVGRLIAKAIYDNKLLDCYFTRAFYKHILNLPVRYQDIESEDPAFFKSLEFLLNNPINDLGLDLTFSLEVEEFGVRSIRDLKPDGRSLDVTDENKVEYVNLVCQMKMTGSIRKQLDAFLTGFYEVIPRQLISMFNEQELELLISGLPDVDIDDLAQNTEYKSYTKTSPQIQWFWRALRSFEQEDRAKFLQFVTGTSKVPLQGFSSLEGMNGVQKFSIHQDSRGGQRLPAAHTCFNQLDLPQYDSYETLRDRLLVAIRECTEGFGFA